MKIILLISFPLFFLSCVTTSFEKDIKVIQKAKHLLSEEKKWSRSYDNQCSELNQYSLFCALKNAQIDIYGKYYHRGNVMKTTRRTIKKIQPQKRFKHPIRDYNQLEEINFNDVQLLLDMIQSKMEFNHKKSQNPTDFCN